MPKDPKNMILVSLSAIIVAVLAQISIPLPFSPVPITGQTLGVFLVSGILGSRLGTWAMVLYVLMGIIGLPVFSAGASGPHQLAGPTGGYLVGFVVAAYVIGWFSERSPYGPKATHIMRTSYPAIGMIIGLGIIYLLGSLHLAGVAHIPLTKAFAIGVLPYILLDVFKMLLAAPACSMVRNRLIKANLMPLLRTRPS